MVLNSTALKIRPSMLVNMVAILSFDHKTIVSDSTLDIIASVKHDDIMRSQDLIIEKVVEVIIVWGRKFDAS